MLIQIGLKCAEHTDDVVLIKNTKKTAKIVIKS